VPIALPRFASFKVEGHNPYAPNEMGTWFPGRLLRDRAARRRFRATGRQEARVRAHRCGRNSGAQGGTIGAAE